MENDKNRKQSRPRNPMKRSTPSLQSSVARLEADSGWETVVDFTKTKAGGVRIEHVARSLSALLAKSRESIQAGKGLSEEEFWKSVANRNRKRTDRK